MIYAIDIETEGTTPDIDDAALLPHHSRITVIGAYSENEQRVFRDLQEFAAWVKPNHQYVFHNHQFDIKHLAYHGVDIRAQYYGDTMLLAVAKAEKIPEEYLQSYDIKRKELNKAGAKHRDAKGYSLKTLAPYYLGVEPFWETNNHDNDEYVLKDAEYTFKLYRALYDLLSQAEKTFYINRLVPWSRTLLDAVVEGIRFDTTELHELEKQKTHERSRLESKLLTQWAEPIDLWRSKRIVEINNDYDEMFNAAIAKNPKNIIKTRERYEKLRQAALAKADTQFNLQSPHQMAWLLKDTLGYDLTNLMGEESTGREVLERLGKTHPDVAVFIKYRETDKLLNAFCESYKQFITPKCRIHTNFNMGGARTGRLSSSSPNVQQAPPEFDRLFIPSPGHKLVTFDQSAIEPRVVAYYTEDPTLIEIFTKEYDFHGYNAKHFFNLPCEPNEVKKLYPAERAIAKTLGLAILYGAGKNRVKIAGLQAGITFDDYQCADIVTRVKETYKASFEYKKYQVDQVLESGEQIYNLFGRPLTIPHEDIYMKGFNTLIQSSASDLVLEAARRISEQFKLNSLSGGPKLLVHDSITVEYPADKEKISLDIIEKAMVDFNLGPVPLKIERK